MEMHWREWIQGGHEL